MIARLVAWIRDLRIQHHSRKANAEGTALLAAQRRRDFPAAGQHLERMIAHRDRRDTLIARQPRRCYVSDPELLAQCADQMSAAQYVAHNNAGDFRRC